MPYLDHMQWGNSLLLVNKQTNVWSNMDNMNKTEEAESENSLSCDLTGLPSFILQFVLGLIAISTLLSK